MTTKPKWVLAFSCALAILGLLALQPHMSGMILILAIGASILFAAGIHLGWFVAGGSFAGVALSRSKRKAS